MIDEHKAQRLASILREIRIQGQGLKLTASFNKEELESGEIKRADIVFLGRKMWVSLEANDDPAAVAAKLLGAINKIAAKIHPSEVEVLQRLTHPAPSDLPLDAPGTPSSEAEPPSPASPSP